MKQNEQTIAENFSEERLEELVQTWRRPLLVCAGRCVNRFVTEQDEEWSVTLLAFQEAVKNYDRSKGDFWPFASTVVQRRLTDHLRKQYKEEQITYVEPGVLTGETEKEAESRGGIDSEVRRSLSEASVDNGDWPGKYTIADEIEAVQEEFRKYGLCFYDLTSCSPKAEKSRKKCTAAAKALLEDAALMEQMEKTGTLPMKELEKKSGVSRKILDKHRRYLIAAAVILRGEYPLLAEYLRPLREEMEK